MASYLSSLSRVLAPVAAARGGAPLAAQTVPPPALTQTVDRVQISADGRAALAAEEALPPPARPSGSDAVRAGDRQAPSATRDRRVVEADSDRAAVTQGSREGQTTEESEAVDGQESDEQAAGDERQTAANGQVLTDVQAQEVSELQRRDREVRQHEQAHVAAAGGLAMGGPSYSYQRGPDGRNYVIGGEVRIDTAPVNGDPQATLVKMAQVRRAALAPAQPSSADRAIAAQAAAQAVEARMALMASRTSEDDEQAANDSAQPQEAVAALAGTESDGSPTSADPAPQRPSATGDVSMAPAPGGGVAALRMNLIQQSLFDMA